VNTRGGDFELATSGYRRWPLAVTSLATSGASAVAIDKVTKRKSRVNLCSKFAMFRSTHGDRRSQREVGSSLTRCEYFKTQE